MRDYKADIKDESEGKGSISRKEALQKTGKYALFTAAAMMSILDPLNANGEDIPPKSPPKPPRPGQQTKKAKRTDPPPSY